MNGWKMVCVKLGIPNASVLGLFSVQWTELKSADRFCERLSSCSNKLSSSEKPSLSF